MKAKRMQEEKNKIRATIRNIKKTITDTEKITASDMVFSVLTRLPEWIQAEKILMYHSLPDELSTIRLLTEIKDKHFFLPKVISNDLEIYPYNKSKLLIGYYNIKEPYGDILPIHPEELDLIIVPGIAFDNEKNRLGRGKGFYDRLLQHTNVIKIGIGYNFQLIESIPHNENDIKMDIVITPNFMIR